MCPSKRPKNDLILEALQYMVEAGYGHVVGMWLCRYVGMGWIDGYVGMGMC